MEQVAACHTPYPHQFSSQWERLAAPRNSVSPFLDAGNFCCLCLSTLFLRWRCCSEAHFICGAGCVPSSKICSTSLQWGAPSNVEGGVNEVYYLLMHSCGHQHCIMSSCGLIVICTEIGQGLLSTSVNVTTKFTIFDCFHNNLWCIL